MEVRTRKWKNADGSVGKSYFVDFFDKALGHRVRETLHGVTSMAAAKKAAARLFVDREQNPKIVFGHDELQSMTLTLRELLDKHRARTGISDSTRKIERDQAKRLTEKIGDNTPLSRITMTTIDAYVEARQDDTKGKYTEKKVGGATILKEVKLLNQALKWAGKRKEYDVIPPFDELPDIPVEKKRPRCLTKEEMKALLEACGDDNTYLRQATEICYLAGLRRAELFRLTWENVHFESDYLKFITVKRGRSTVRRVDIVYLPKRAMHLLQLRYESLGKPDKSGLVFGVPSRQWNSIETTVDLTFSDSVQAAARRAGIQRSAEVGAHTLRHSCATHLLESGATVPEAANHLRHRDGGALLLRTYAHTHEAGLRRAAGILAGETYNPGLQEPTSPPTAQKGTTNVIDIAKVS